MTRRYYCDREWAVGIKHRLTEAEVKAWMCWNCGCAPIEPYIEEDDAEPSEEGEGGSVHLPHRTG